MSFYGVCFYKDREFKIFDNWADCSKALKGRPNFQKGFDTEEEAQEWLDSLSTEEINKRARSADFFANKKRG